MSTPCRLQRSLPVQRRREAYRRYCKLRDRGKLKNGSNPPLSAADNLSPAASSAVAHDAAAWAENGEASKAEAAEAVQQAALEQATGQAEAAAAAGQKRPRGQRWGDAWTLCFRGTQEQRQQVRSVRLQRMMLQSRCYKANYGLLHTTHLPICGSCSAAVLGRLTPSAGCALSRLPLPAGLAIGAPSLHLLQPHDSR